MRHNDQERRHDTRAIMMAIAPAIAAVVLMLVGTAATIALMGMEAFRPKVGDFVVFRQALPDGDNWHLAIPASNVAERRPSDGPCVIDPNVIAKTGGSLIVEFREDASALLYHLHWAGTHTAAGEGDCGREADLTVTRTDLQKLANAAGGFGISTRGRF